MITDEELSRLPADPELAFVKFEHILRERLQAEEREASQGEYDADPARLEYMNKVAAAAKVYQIAALSELEVPLDAQNRLFQDLQRFTRDVDYVTMQIRIHSTRSDRQVSVGLDAITKTKIHHFIAQIREAIERSDLPEDERDALYNKLNKFAAEVDRARTGFHAGMAVYIAICGGIAQGFEKLEPARKWIDSIAALMGRAKENEERVEHKLPPPPERQKIEPPKRRLPPPQKANVIDDDIPF